jgi:hypothetical protein
VAECTDASGKAGLGLLRLSRSGTPAIGSGCSFSGAALER